MRGRHGIVAAVSALLLALISETAQAQEVRLLGSGGVAGPATTPAEQKIVSSLRGLAAAFRAQGVTRQDAEAAGVSERFSTPTLRVDPVGRVQVYVSVADAGDATLARLRHHDLDVELVNAEFRLVQGWIPVDKLHDLAAEPAVLKIRPPSYARTRLGSVTSQGDGVHRCDLVRSSTGITGAGVKVGVVSDGVSGLASSQASGNLPAGVQVLSSSFGDEGTAMLEIIADCAPGASLAFSTGFPTSLAFINSVNALRNAGARVIVDDLGFFSEPFFEDGPVALNDRVVGSQVLRVSAAGNEREAHYHGMFTPGPPDPELGGVIQHNFGGGDTRLRIAAFAGQVFTIILQWGNRFGQAGDDYDLCVRTIVGLLVGCAADVQDGNDDPVETASLQCSGSGTCFVDLEIVLFSGVARPLKLFCLGCDVTELNTFANSLFGHPAVPEVLAVAAVPASSPTMQEPFSSEGDGFVLFPVVEVRAKPDLAGVDGVATSRAGFSPFFGTSAAAPHVAAVAALVIQANPTYQLDLFTPMLRQALRDTAVDLGAPGRDTIFGAGRADAVNGVQNELSKARCQVQSSAPVVTVGQGFTLTVDTFPGSGDPWDIYVLAVLVGTNPHQLLSLNFASGAFGPIGVVNPARPTAPITASTQTFNFVAPVTTQVGLVCLLVDPGFTRVSPLSFAPLSLVAP